MLVRIDNVSHYKKIIAAICSVPSVRKQLNSVEQCIELKTNKEDNVLEISTVDLTSHAIKLKMPAEIIDEGRQIVLSNKLKAMSSRLNPKFGLEISSKDNLLNYEMKPYGSIVDNQYFSQDSVLSDELFNEDSYTDVCSDLGFFLDLLPIACSNTYNDREIYITTDPTHIMMYVQFTETSYIRYKSITNTYATSEFRAAVRPALLRIVHHLGEAVKLVYSKSLNAIKFISDEGEMAFIVDTSVNKICKKVDSIVDNDGEAYIEVAHEDLSESIKWQSYNATETDIVCLDFDVDEEQFTIQIDNRNKNKPSNLEVNYSGLFEKTNLSVGHITKALKAMGTPKNKILPIETVKINIKKIAVKNTQPITAVHLCPDREDDVTSDVIIYEARC
jgi:hypothetical protein